MRYSQMLIPTLREAPSDAEVTSQKLMMRGGYIRKLAAGVYVYLPLALRVLRKIESIVRDEMKKGDQVFFYHSNSEEPGIVGIMQVVKEGYPDPTAFDPKHHHYDPQSSADNPRWMMVDVKLVKKFKKPVFLAELRKNPKLKNMKILQKGNRLSVTSVTQKEWECILEMSQKL